MISRYMEVDQIEEMGCRVTGRKRERSGPNVEEITQRAVKRVYEENARLHRERQSLEAALRQRDAEVVTLQEERASLQSDLSIERRKIGDNIVALEEQVHLCAAQSLGAFPLPCTVQTSTTANVRAHSGEGACATRNSGGLVLSGVPTASTQLLWLLWEAGMMCLCGAHGRALPLLPQISQDPNELYTQLRLPRTADVETIRRTIRMRKYDAQSMRRHWLGVTAYMKEHPYLYSRYAWQEKVRASVSFFHSGIKFEDFDVKNWELSDWLSTLRVMVDSTCCFECTQQSS